MKKRVISLFLCAMMTTTIVGCGKGPEITTPTQTTNPSESASEPASESSVSDDSAHKADHESEHNIDAYNWVAEGEINYQKYLNDMLVLGSDKTNMCYSPLSFNTALEIYSKLIEDNEAKDEILDFINHINYSQYESVTDEEDGVYKIVNRIWANSNWELNFDNMGVDDLLYFIDMSDSATATAKKNAYVDEQTNHFIQSTPTVFDNDVLIDVMNVVYFKDAWYGGDLDMTSEDYDFINYDGTVVSKPMMIADSNYYYENDSCYAIPMFYENTGATFYAIYPKGSLEDVHIDDILSEDSRVSNDAYIRLPEFEAYVELNISNYNDEIGLSHFDETKPLYTSEDKRTEITQVVKIKVDHEGTEAAAVTEMMDIANCAMPVQEPLDLTFDKPFYYMIEDINGDIAFIGRVMELEN